MIFLFSAQNKVEDLFFGNNFLTVLNFLFSGLLPHNAPVNNRTIDGSNNFLKLSHPSASRGMHTRGIAPIHDMSSWESSSTNDFDTGWVVRKAAVPLADAIGLNKVSNNGK